jgi:Holliday junction resolvase RusA-like endonuclease
MTKRSAKPVEISEADAVRLGLIPGKDEATRAVAEGFIEAVKGATADLLNEAAPGKKPPKRDYTTRKRSRKTVILSPPTQNARGMVEVEFPYPIGANHYKRHVCAVNPKHAINAFRIGPVKEWDADVAALKAEARGPWGGPIEPIEGNVVVYVGVYRPRRVGDLEGVLKLVFDALQGLAYGNDSQITEISAYRYEDKDRPRVEISIVPERCVTGPGKGACPKCYGTGRVFEIFEPEVSETIQKESTTMEDSSNGQSGQAG